LPTAQQAIQAVILSQWLSNGYQPINILRFDSNLKTIYLQAGVTESIAIVIFADGEWRFVE
jgi:hypothetical protein